MANAERIEKRGSAATVRACDLCRKRKRRCLWNSGSQGCTPCTNLKETCTTTHVRKQRAKPQRGGRIAEYESRIHKLESLLQERNAAQPQVEDQPLQPADPTIPATQWVANLREEIPSIPIPAFPDFEAVYGETFVDEHGLRPIVVCAEPPTTLPAGQLPELGVQHDFENIPFEPFEPSAEFQEDAALVQSEYFELQSAGEHTEIPPVLPSTSSCDWYLPPPELGTALLSEYLVDLNTACPLYRPHVLADHLRVCYAGESDGSAVSWVSAYLIFGLAYGLRAMSAAAAPQDNELSRYYLSRTYTSLTGLLLSPPSLGLVQCLIGVAILCRSSPCGRNVPDGHFLSTSLRIAQTLAYHDDGIEEAESDRDVEQERRVFWLGFINDTNVSMLSNAPTTQRREDIVAPKPDPSDSLGAVVAAEGHWKVNIFSLRVNLALLQAEAIEQVLSAKARNTLPLHVDAAATIVLARLQSFHEHELFTLSPEQLFTLLYRSDVTHTVSIEATYFATVYRIHAFLALEKNPRINPFTSDGLRRMSAVKEQKSYAAAQRLLSLLPIAPRGDCGLYWQHHHALIAAVVTLLAHHVNNPKAPAATKADLRVCNTFIQDLEVLAEKSTGMGDTGLVEGRIICMDLFARLETSLFLGIRSEARRCREEGMQEQ